MWICLDSPDVKDFRFRIVVAAVSSRNRRLSPATFMVTTGRRLPRSIGISSFLSWVWARTDPKKQATRKTRVATRVVGFMESPIQIDRPLTGVLFRRKDRACPRSAHLPRRAFAKPEKLFQVMLPMHQMKLSPLCRSQRAQKRMVEQVDPGPEARLTLRDDRIHRHNLCPDLVSHLLRRQAFRQHHR